MCVCVCGRVRMCVYACVCECVCMFDNQMRKQCFKYFSWIISTHDGHYIYIYIYIYVYIPKTQQNKAYFFKIPA